MRVDENGWLVNGDGIDGELISYCRGVMSRRERERERGTEKGISGGGGSGSLKYRSRDQSQPSESRTLRVVLI